MSFKAKKMVHQFDVAKVKTSHAPHKCLTASTGELSEQSSIWFWGAQLSIQVSAIKFVLASSDLVGTEHCILEQDLVERYDLVGICLKISRLCNYWIDRVLPTVLYSPHMCPVALATSLSLFALISNCVQTELYMPVAGTYSLAIRFPSLREKKLCWLSCT